MKAPMRVIRRFFETTTLHGFKYLFAKYYCDRFGWLICCCASACCAAVLCTVVWARFMQVPALLSFQEMKAHLKDVEMPLVAVCPPAETVAKMFAKHFNVNETISKRLPAIFVRVLRRKYTSEQRLAIIGDIIDRHNLTFTQALFKIMPECDSMLLICLWQNRAIPCGRLFHKELSQWGYCCIAKPKDFKIASTVMSRVEIMRTLSISLQCYNEPTLHSCDFFTKYDVEEWFEPVPLAPGFSYEAHLTSISVIDSDPEKLLDGTCAVNQYYSRSRCLLKCMERRCGCSDVIRIYDPNEMNIIPTCPIQKLNCLRAYQRDNTSCNCLPTCKKVTTSLALESTQMNALNHTIHSLYSSVDITKGSVINIRLRISGSRMFAVNPTETWITLLSSLGGVFNMFLGVGFFSALEVLFLILVRLPMAIRRSTEMENPVAPR